MRGQHAGALSVRATRRQLNLPTLTQLAASESRQRERRRTRANAQQFNLIRLYLLLRRARRRLPIGRSLAHLPARLPVAHGRKLVGNSARLLCKMFDDCQLAIMQNTTAHKHKHSRRLARVRDRAKGHKEV